ncbi:MAG: hypothetical protein ACOCRK_08620 [bacterium]
MSNPTKILVFSLLFILIFSSNMLASESDFEKLSVLPEFSLKDSEGQERSNYEFVDDLVLFTFMVADECTACNLTLKELSNVVNNTNHSIQPVFVLQKVTNEFVDRVKTLLPNAIILEDQTNVLGSQLKVTHAPSMYIFNNGLYHGQIPWNAYSSSIIEFIDDFLGKDTTNDMLITSGDSVPVIEGLKKNKEQITLEKLEQPTLIIFSSIYCYVCIEQIANIEEIDADGFEILVIGKECHEELSENGIKYSLEYIHDYKGEMFNKFGVSVTPTFIVGYEDQILDVWYGKTPIDEIVDLVINIIT